MVPAMPATLFSNYLYQKLSDEMVITDNEGSRYLTKSMVYNAQVRSFPPKPKISEALRQSDPELVELLEAGSQDSLDEVYPSDVSVENCGSNLGLAGILKGIYTDYGVENGDNDYYIPILVDVNLYHRMLKASCHCSLICCCTMHAHKSLVRNAHATYVACATTVLTTGCSIQFIPAFLQCTAGPVYYWRMRDEIFESDRTVVRTVAHIQNGTHSGVQDVRDDFPRTTVPPHRSWT